MERLRHTDLTALLAASQELLAYRTLDAFPAAAVRAIGQLVPGIRHGCIVVDLRSRRTVALASDPPDAMPSGMDQIAARCAHEHPLVIRRQEMRGGQTHKISDFVTRREFMRTSTYAEVYRPIDAFDQLGFEMPSPDGVVVGIGVNRGRTPFTERDRAVLDLLRPHVAEAYRAARMGSTMQAALDASARAVVALDADGQARFATERARDLLRAYFQQTMGGNALPDVLAEWARSRIRQPQCDGDSPATPTPLIVAGEAGRLVVRLVAATGMGEGDLLLLHEERAAPSVAMLVPLGLSPREGEVLLWVMRGKADKEIAALLGCGTRTVRKHLEHIYAKLDVSSRTAAVSRAFAVCTGADPFAL
ncbi:MAG: helix-turn-helix transcriptional regulator [Thermomicrobiales bacterium]